jgi:hypothetical protein
LYGLENKICDPTRFGSNSYSLLDPILVSVSITVIESTTIQINRTNSDHDLTYILVNCGYHNQGRIQDFKLGGAHLKKSCAEQREARKYLGYFV